MVREWKNLELWGKLNKAPVCKRKDSGEPPASPASCLVSRQTAECAAGDVWCESSGGGTASPSRHVAGGPGPLPRAATQAAKQARLTTWGRQSFRFRLVADVIRQKKTPAEINKCINLLTRRINHFFTISAEISSSTKLLLWKTSVRRAKAAYCNPWQLVAKVWLVVAL
jgi:hypothetical protein